MTTAIREMNQRLGAPGRVAILLIAVAIVVLLVSFRGLGRAILAPSAKEVQSLQNEKIKQLAAEYSKTLEQQAAQFTGRSVFFIPSPPPPKPPPAPPVVDKEPEKPAPPPPPATYGGPKLIAMVNDEAWFEDGQKLTAGAEGKDGLKIKGLRPPWNVAVVWKDVDFTVSLFDRDKIVFPAKEDPSIDPSKITEAPKIEQAPTPKPSKPPEPMPEAPKPQSTPGEPVPPQPTAPPAPRPGEPAPTEPEPKPGEPAPTAPEPKPVEPAPTVPEPKPVELKPPPSLALISDGPKTAQPALSDLK